MHNIINNQWNTRPKMKAHFCIGQKHDKLPRTVYELLIKIYCENVQDFYEKIDTCFEKNYFSTDSVIAHFLHVFMRKILGWGKSKKSKIAQNCGKNSH